MVGVTNLQMGGNIAQGLVRANSIASKPAFELQFNMLQNTIIDRLNKKIIEAQAEDELQNGKIDFFLLQSAKKLQRVDEGIKRFLYENAHNTRAMGPILKHLDKLDDALDANDTTAFNKELKKLNTTTGKLKVTDGSTVGIFIDDGIRKLRNSGVVRYDDSGTAKRATTLGDFASISDARAAVAAARTEIPYIVDTLVYKQQGAETVRQATEKSLNSTILQINAALIADQANKAEEIAKLREQYGQLLNVLSLAFESSQILTDRLGTALFEGPQFDKGSVINLFI